MNNSTSHVTVDHEVIRDWVEDRKGYPALIGRTEDNKGGGTLRIGFRDEDALDEIDWKQFFEVFEKNNLAFLYQEKTRDGSLSRFNKFVDRKKNKDKVE